ncbi:hypothetical protein F511_03798 [Dorcoceras hygrometricum]|uniref:HTH three-helical bundle domain-containing protein n=1 Tax=Dorcoceras hygrometricum TaxID=472368 RepID=A0A2Z7BVS8_9LAMI|nr:hypothetical protein F511_03798 [Dorcoceras hygrometricum]
MTSKTEKASFPSNLERTVASVLLLLSSLPPKEMLDDFSTPESYQNSRVSVSKSSDGSWSSETSVDEPSAVTFVPRFHHELKLKVARKKRSKSIWVSEEVKLASSKPTTSSDCVSNITSADASSCLSSNTSVRSHRTESKAIKKMRKPVVSTHMGHQAEAILRILSKGNASEVKIRQLLGDSPSTSKALRM